MGEDIKADKTHCTVMSYELMMLDEVFRRADEFDVIHNHVGFQALAFADFVDTPVHSGPALAPDAEIRGPALIEEPFTVVVVPPGTTARLDGLGNYVLEAS